MKERVRPRSAYAFGNIDLWRALHRTPRPAPTSQHNFRFLRETFKKLVAGIPKPGVPFRHSAPQTFKPGSARREKMISEGHGFSRAVQNPT